MNPLKSSGMVRFFHGKSLMLAEAVFVLYGFFKAAKPSEAFLTPYLIAEKNLTNNQVHNDVYPVWTYAFFLWIVPITLIAQHFGYRTAIMLESLGHISTRVILIFGEGLLMMQAMQVTFALAIAGELVYYAYVFKVFATPEAKQKMISFSQASVLLGHCLASTLGQILVLNDVPYIVLFYISAGTVGVACLISLFFPPDRAVNSIQESADNTLDDEELERPLLSPQDKDIGIQDAARTPTSPKPWYAHSNLLILLPPILIFAFHKAHLYNIAGFSSTLWVDIGKKQFNWTKSDMKPLNGFMDAGSRGLAALCALIAYQIMKRTSEAADRVRVFCVTALLSASTVLTFGMALTRDLYIAYALHVVIVGLSGAISALISVWLADAATSVFSGRGKVFAGIFGVATLVAAGSQSLVQLILNLCHLDIIPKFYAFGMFAALLTAISMAESVRVAYMHK